MLFIAFFTFAVMFGLESAQFTELAHSAGCAKTCVSVTREGGELVITARRDPIKRRPTVSAPSPTSTPLPPSRTTAKKVSPPRRTTPRPTLSNQIRELLPKGSFTVLPRAGAVIYEPLLIHAHGCAPFRKTLPILDTSIILDLRSTIEWSWGDGPAERWPGAAVRGAHIYQQPGRYLIVMRCRWGGEYRTPDSSWAPIPEGIISTSQQSIELFRAQVFFTE